MSLRSSSTSTFANEIAHQSMMAGWEWAQRSHWLYMARAATGDLAFMRKSHVECAKESHRKMLMHIRLAKLAGAK